MAKEVYDFYNHDQKFWGGPRVDPYKSDNKSSWVGLENYVPDKSAINDLSFVTNFNLNDGENYYIMKKFQKMMSGIIERFKTIFQIGDGLLNLMVQNFHQNLILK